MKAATAGEEIGGEGPRRKRRWRSCHSPPKPHTVPHPRICGGENRQLKVSAHPVGLGAKGQRRAIVGSGDVWGINDAVDVDNEALPSVHRLLVHQPPFEGGHHRSGRKLTLARVVEAMVEVS